MHRPRWARGASEFQSPLFHERWKRGVDPGKLNPKIEKPAGPIDPAVSVVYFELADGAPMVSYVNFSMHPDTVGGLQISADYAGPLCNTLARIKGDSMITMFTNGTCGDINHVNVNTKDAQKGFDEARRIGTILAGEVIKTYARLKPIDADAVRFSEVVTLQLPKFTSEELQKARQTAVKFGKDMPPFLQRVNAFKVIDVAAGGETVGGGCAGDCAGGRCGVGGIAGGNFCRAGAGD